MKDIISGWVIVAIVYLLTYIASVICFQLLFQRPIDDNWNQSGLFIGFFMIVIPYLCTGIFIRKSFLQPIKVALLMSIVPCILEKIFIYGLGTLFIRGINHPIYNDLTPNMFIRGDAGLPYFTSWYCSLGVLSIIICVIAATCNWSNSIKEPLK